MTTWRVRPPRRGAPIGRRRPKALPARLRSPPSPRSAHANAFVVQTLAPGPSSHKKKLDQDEARQLQFELREEVALVSPTVLSSGKQRAFMIVPSAEDNKLEPGVFKVVGVFAIEEKINNARKVHEAFDSSERVLLR